jgi:hypothetical protein
VYLHLEQKERELAIALAATGEKKSGGVDAEPERQPRTQEDMSTEATRLRSLLAQTENIWE